METFGSRVRSARLALGLTQEQLGFELGVTKAAISKWENGSAEPDIASIRRLRTVLKVTLDGLLDGYPDPAAPFADEGEGAVRYGRDRYTHAIDEQRAANPQEAQLLRSFRKMSQMRKKALMELLR